MMSMVQQQFADEWKKVSIVVESEARRQLLTIGHLDYLLLNDVLQEEIETWFKSNSVRNQWFRSLNDSGDIDKEIIILILRHARLHGLDEIGNKSISVQGIKGLCLLLCLFAGFLVYFGTHLYFSLKIQDYASSPFKWTVFPLLTIVLTYTFCKPYIAKSKANEIERLIKIVNDEMKEKGLEIFEGLIKLI